MRKETPGSISFITQEGYFSYNDVNFPQLLLISKNAVAGTTGVDQAGRVSGNREAPVQVGAGEVRAHGELR